jgi:hypothetical protein
MVGKHGSPVQFFFTPYSNLIAMMASTCEEKISQNGCVRTEWQTFRFMVSRQVHVQEEKNIFRSIMLGKNNISTSLVFFKLGEKSKIRRQGVKPISVR